MLHSIPSMGPFGQPCGALEQEQEEEEEGGLLTSNEEGGGGGRGRKEGGKVSATAPSGVVLTYRLSLVIGSQ